MEKHEGDKHLLSFLFYFFIVISGSKNERFDVERNQFGVSAFETMSGVRHQRSFRRRGFYRLEEGEEGV